MKPITKYIKHKIPSKSQYDFKFKINKDIDIYAEHPTNRNDLQKIVLKRLENALHEDPNHVCLDLSDVDVRKIKEFDGIFDFSYYNENFARNLSEVSEIDISNWNTSNAESFNMLFNNCDELENIIGIEHLDTSNVKDMFACFRNCYHLTNINLSNWDVSNVEDMSKMFYNCIRLQDVGDLDKWDVTKTEDMNRMFAFCYTLSNIGNINNWKINRILDASQMFEKCKRLKIDLSDWREPWKCENMFKECELMTIPAWYED